MTVYLKRTDSYFVDCAHQVIKFTQTIMEKELNVFYRKPLITIGHLLCKVQEPKIPIMNYISLKYIH